MTLDFSQTAAGMQSTAQLQFKGENLRGSLELSVGGLNASYFTLSTDNVAASAANATSGTWITVTYTPRTEGEHTANLIITDGGLDEGSRIVKLRGECLPKPELTAPVATAPTDVTREGYTANWETPQGETVDYYVVTLRRYAGASVTEEELLAEDNSLDITGFADDDYHTYSVRSSRLGVTSPASNVITVNHSSAICTIGADTPFVVEAFDGGLVRFRCSEPLTAVTFHDLAGRPVLCLDRVDDLMEIIMPRGVYVVTASSRVAPVKVVVY